MKISDKKKKEGRYCCAYACRNKPESKKGGLCHKHYARRIKERDKVYARYNQMKSKATSRGIEFTITLPHFRAFCKRTGYLKKGYRGRVASIDRRCNAQGYHFWNIQIMSAIENAKKYHNYDKEKYKPLPF